MGGLSPLDQWIDWLETKEPDERYDWRYVPGCACGQFFGDGWQAIKETSVLNSIARGFNCPTNETDWTFGRCLERAKHFREHQYLGWHA